MCMEGADTGAALTPIPEEETVFSSSKAEIVLPSDTPVSAQAKGLAILILFAAILGLVNGIDFASPESGLVRPHEFINTFSEQAPPASAVLDGVIYITENEPAVGYVVELVYMNGTIHQNITNGEGEFHFEKIDPGLAELWIHTEDFEKGVQHRILMTPPVPGLEPVGYTHLEIVMPTEEDYAASCEGEEYCVPWVDMTPEEMEQPLMDPRAGDLYSMLGIFFMGMAILSSVFAVQGYRSGSRGMLRTAAAIVFFTQGHFYSACCIGMMSLGLSFAVPIRE